MWILVVGPSSALDRPDGGVATLRDLGCRVRTADLWDALDAPELAQTPPAAILVEALDQVAAGKAALVRLREVPHLAAVPTIVAVTVRGLGALDPTHGFDDFVLCPYVPAELYVRVRREEWRKSEFTDAELVKIGPLVIDVAGHEVSVDGRSVDLTNQEFSLLQFLSSNRGRVYSRDQLLARVWGVDYYGGSRTVDIHVRRLRMKLGHGAKSLETVRGVGYKMKAP